MNHEDNTNQDKGDDSQSDYSLPSEVQEVIDNWRSYKIKPEQQAFLPEVMPIVRECVAAANPTAPAVARQFLWITTQFMLWGYEEFRHTDTNEVITAHNVEYFVAYANAHRTDGWKHLARPVLRRIGRAVNPDGWPQKPPSLGPSKIALPYTSDDEGKFSFAASNSEASNRAGRLAVVAFTFGAGLRGPEVAEAMPSDLESRDDGRIVVNVRGGWPRHVPVRAAYSDLVRQAVEAANGTKFLKGGSHSPSSVIGERLLEEPRVTGRRNGLSLRRARNTWLAAHLRANTPVAALRILAGQLSPKLLNGLLDHVCADIDPEDAVEQGLQI